MWKDLEDKLKKSGRKWTEIHDNTFYRRAELFCKECGASLGIHDMVTTDLETVMYCSTCVQKYIKEVPIILPCGTVTMDCGSFVYVEYQGNHYEKMTVQKTCYFNKKGSYIKVKGKRYYI